jgi:hypothetical protein
MCVKDATAPADVLADLSEACAGIVIALLAEDGEKFSYRPTLKKITGDVLAALLLGRVIKWWHTMGKKPFYKFRKECKHPWYKRGDSWIEEMDFTVTEYDTARNRIATKIEDENKLAETLAQSMAEKPDPKKLVIYWTFNNVTWWVLNDGLLTRMIGIEKAESAKQIRAAQSESKKPNRGIRKGDSRNQKTRPLSLHYSLRNKLTHAKQAAAKNGDGDKPPATPAQPQKAAAAAPDKLRAFLLEWDPIVPDSDWIRAALEKAKSSKNVIDLFDYAAGILRSCQEHGWQNKPRVPKPPTPSSAPPPSPAAAEEKSEGQPPDVPIETEEERKHRRDRQAWALGDKTINLGQDMDRVREKAAALGVRLPA